MTRQPGPNLTLYGLGAIGLLLVAEYFGAVAPSLALLGIVTVIAIAAMSSVLNNERHTRRGWSLAGTVLAAVAAVGGLAMVAMAVVLFVALSSGNFKFGNK